MNTETASPKLSPFEAALFGTRFFLIMSLAVALWMVDCMGELSVSRIVKERGADKVTESLRKALGGCKTPAIPALVTGSLAEFSVLLPTQADREEFRLGLKRDYRFIGFYTFGYLSLASLLRWRTGVFSGRKYVRLAFALTLLTAFCDVRENKNTELVLDRLKGEYGEVAPPKHPDVVTEEDEAEARGDVVAKLCWSYGKWGANFALCMMLTLVFYREGSRRQIAACCLLVAASVLGLALSHGNFYAKLIACAAFALAFTQWRDPWQILTCGLLFGGGVSGILLGGFRPVFIECAFGAVLLGGLVGLVILIGKKAPDELWKPLPAEQPLD